MPIISTITLNKNEIFSSLENMIISQEVFVAPLAHKNESLVDMAKVDGSLFGDKKLYYSTDCLKSYDWLNDAEAANLLKLFRPGAPKVQEIVLDKFRQIPVTVDYYLTKRAWMGEGAFSQFTSVMLGWINNTKRTYDTTLYNAYIGTEETSVGKQKQTIELPVDAGDLEKQARLRAQTIAKFVADILVELGDPSRDYNDYGFLRSTDSSDLIIVWNSKAVNEITKMDLPTIFHKDGLLSKLGDNSIPSKYFGTRNSVGGTTTGSNTTVRALVELDFNTAELGKPGYDVKKHVFPGQLLPNNQKYEANTTYTEDDTILFKIIHKGGNPFMSAFETATSFFNPKSLTETHYLTWGHNTLEHLSEYPFIVVRGHIAG